MKTNYQKVVDFNRTFGVTTHDVPQSEIFTQDPDLVKLRDSLIYEENQEMHEAAKEHDLVEVVDAWADLEYVTHGAASSFGVDLDAHLDASRLASIEEEKPDREIFTREPEKVKFHLEQVEARVQELKTASEKHDLEAYTKALCQILYVVHESARAFGVDLNKAFDLVHTSNMSKSCVDEAKAQETVTWYQEHEARYDSPAYRPSEGEAWIVYNESTGKVLKSVDYNPVDLTYLLGGNPSDQGDQSK